MLVQLLFQSTAFSSPYQIGDEYHCPVNSINNEERSAFSGSQWKSLIRGALHGLGGDDLRAYFGFEPAPLVVNAYLPNSYALRNASVIISSGLLQLISSESELAFVLAHEIGHVVYGHQNPEHKHMTPHERVEHFLQLEVEADRYAVKLLQESGYDRYAGLQVLHRLTSFGRDAEQPLGKRFPTLSQRHQILQKHLEAQDQRAGQSSLAMLVP